MITIYDWFGYELPIKERYHLIKKAGFDGVLLWWSNGFGRDSFGPNHYRKGPQIARESGLFIENIHAPVQEQNKLWLDNLDGETILDCYLQCIKDCDEFEIPTMVVHLPSEKYLYNELGLNRIMKIADKAEQLGVNVALENLHNVVNLSYMLNQVNSSRIGFCYDCCHHNNYNSSDDLLSMFGSRLMALHLHDNGGSYNQHQLPFDGTIDWNVTMKKIAEANYTGATALEPMNWDYKDLSPEEFLIKAFEKAKRLEAFRFNSD